MFEDIIPGAHFKGVYLNSTSTGISFAYTTGREYRRE